MRGEGEEAEAEVEASEAGDARDDGEREAGRKREAGLEREAAVLVLLDEALASWCAWGKGGAGEGEGGAVLRQRMADLLIELMVAKAALRDARGAAGAAKAAKHEAQAKAAKAAKVAKHEAQAAKHEAQAAKHEAQEHEALRVLQHQVRRSLRLAAQEIGESRGEDRVRWMREELFRRGQEAGAAGAALVATQAEPGAPSRPANAASSASAASSAGAASPSSAAAAGSFDLGLWQRFCAEVVKPAAVEADRRGEVSREIWAALGELGYLQLFHGEAQERSAPPAQAAHAQATPQGALLPAMQALAEACGATFWKATISSALCGKMLAAFAQPARQARWSAALASGRAIGAFAASERGSGSDPASYAARLHRRGGAWQLDGEKDRISNAADADVAAVLCPAFDEAGAPLGLALAVVELAAAGVSRHRHATMGLRAMTFGRLRFAGVALDDAAVTLGTTMPKILTVVEWGQVVQALAGLGAGRAALAEAERFLAERRSFGRPLAGHPALREQLDGARRRLDAAWALTREAVEGKARGEVAGEPIVAAKISGSEAGLAACQAALRLCGGWGYTAELAVERLVRDAHGNLPAGLPNDRLRELLIAPRLGVDPWATRA
jgi:alkylation response protein AidB-like acyl-CoA dehydrogenase